MKFFFCGRNQIPYCPVSVLSVGRFLYPCLADVCTERYIHLAHFFVFREGEGGGRGGGGGGEMFHLYYSFGVFVRFCWIIFSIFDSAFISPFIDVIL